MKKVPLVALQMLNYPSGGKRWNKGESFEALSEEDANLLVSIGLAKRNNESVTKVVQPPKAEPKDDLPQSLIALRELYHDMTGQWPDMRLGVSKLKVEIDRYQRRDMRAEE